MEQAASPFIGESKMQQLSQHRSRRGTLAGGRPRTVSPLQGRRESTLAAFARAERQQLQVLRGAEVTASLHRAVEGMTRLASLLPVRRG